MTEADLLAAIIDLIAEVSKAHRSRRLLWHHCGDSRKCTGPRGFPDLFIAGEHGFIIAELKSDTGEQSADQQLWAWLLFGLTAESVVTWTPRELDNGWIRAELESIV